MFSYLTKKYIVKGKPVLLVRRAGPAERAVKRSVTVSRYTQDAQDERQVLLGLNNELQP
jgi:hypothetical protein